ncbi:DUF1206 domain-containing protein [Nonomuraea typhae]|uniref:DUF1206 domain-containing protein n=1 Tax=Nonomuraea typhae TaxID=2603600 RepID=A0ABW7ZAC2_9ACTN
MAWLARTGLVCRGMLYALIGLLAIQLAAGRPDPRLLWIILGGFVALALWQLSETGFGKGDALDRVQSAGRVAVYLIMVATLRSVLTAGRTLSGDLLDLPGGPVILAGIGFGLIALGLYWLHRGAAFRFSADLAVARMSPRVRAAMVRLGLAGYVARGLIAILAGSFVVVVAATADPQGTNSIGATLRAFARTAAGAGTLWVVALGLLVFAAYCFAEARWRRV